MADRIEERPARTKNQPGPTARPRTADRRAKQFTALTWPNENARPDRPHPNGGPASQAHRCLW
ncbi:hypothetical protein DV20_13930 [Amycolatopsis rifamycinica]|uniref:Uncharacterized protein n=1 Tax=Amycolatopsis rifamycinica TaxID=287986 RepID=A0A066U3A2_9PSEU|nr:hypothetical protein DV20_13930 [Amycolatopsis rifamycinica]